MFYFPMQVWKMAKTVGIVAEYNPFHNGHKAQINRIRECLGQDTVIVAAMSGDFVQRGEPALLNKHARAEAACRGGVDLVLELPLPWSILSAERFAEAGVFLLNALQVGTLCFGAETEDRSLLERTAELLLREDTNAEITRRMKEKPNLSYAQAREQVLSEQTGSDLDWLEKPNNILAVEYSKAVKKNGYAMELMPLQRIGAEHDGRDGDGEIRSASYIREQLAAGAAPEFVPESTAELLCRETAAGRCPVILASLETALLSRLRMLPESSFIAGPDAMDGAGNRLYQAVRTGADYEEVCSLAKTKRYAMSRIRRMLLCTALGVSAELSETLPPYARVLAASDRGCGYLNTLRKTSLLPLIVKPAEACALPGTAPSVFQLGADARDLYVLGYPSGKEAKPGSDYRTSPHILHL